MKQTMAWPLIFCTQEKIEVENQKPEESVKQRG